MATGPQAFYCLWQEERIRETFFELLSKKDIRSVRLANSACCNLVTKRLFLRTHLTFTANTFTKASRVQALSRIGHHVEHLTFYLPHSDATFLPPLIHPVTGREISFLYTPHTCMASVLTRPKYANHELGDVLTQQYPPLFHAATNVPSFLNAVKHMPNIRHMTIKCPGQDPKERYRRDIVDYALISLRISIERTPLLKLSKLSLSGVHPAAFNYLRHVPGFGSHPAAARRWRQIRKLYVSVDTWDFEGPSPGLDHLKIIDDYVRNMAPHLEKFSFTWLGDNGSGVSRGPCPIALSGDSLFSPPREGPKKLFNEVTGPMSPLPPAPRREPMHFPRLRCMTLRNATMNTPQLRDLVERHRGTVREFDFENVSLTDGGSYEDAFSQLLAQVTERGSNVWSRTGPAGKKNSGSDPDRRHKDSDDASDGQNKGAGNVSQLNHHSFRVASGFYTDPLSPAPSSVLSGPPAVASLDDVELSSPSAAVAAVSRELLDLPVEDLESYLGLSAELPFMLDSPSDTSGTRNSRSFIRTPPPPSVKEEDEASRLHGDEDDGGLASDIAAAHEASLTFTTNLKKKRVRHHRRKHHANDGNGSKAEERESRFQRHHHRHHRHRPDEHDSKSRSGRGEGNKRERSNVRSKSRSQSRSKSSQGQGQHRSRKNSSTTRGTATPPPPLPPPSAPPIHPFAHRTPPPQPPQPRPAIVGQYNNRSSNSNVNIEDDDVFGPRTGPGAMSTASAEVAPLNISAPILNAEPLPVLLQPAVYDPFASSMVNAGSAVPTGASKPASPSASIRSSAEDDGLSPVQRQILGQETAQQRRRLVMAEDADARSSALKKAKEAVLTKLSREFNRRMGRQTAQMAAAAAAATAAAAAASVSMPMSPQQQSFLTTGYGWDSRNNKNTNGDRYGTNFDSNTTTATLSLLSSLRLRERLFGEPLSGTLNRSASSSSSAAATAANYYQHHSMDSNTAVVPLVFCGA
ncbi:hypothetical protein SPI_00357 [Niveomyces insectorum RCEF 264]|uniref:Uncharacterized protein n=1 Tax=Niveomyces insectorum RCEF 264 TaxID=1081102 RepID=A0A162JFI6_9HYPO|nr:hypothetical protein SPI_00357 [Niveomyces insectorum RCEF 264]